MTERALGVEQAFRDLEQAPATMQGLLHPILIKSLQDPALMRQLGTTGLSQHLAVVGRLLTSLPSDGIGPILPPLKTFLHLTIGEDVDDAEEAFEYVRTLDAPVRARVEGGLTRALHSYSMRAGGGTISLLALARLLALAFSNMPFVAHVLDGGEIEPFLPHAASRPPQTQDDSSRSRFLGQRSTPALHVHEAGSDHLAELVGAVVEVISVVSDDSGERRTGHVFATIGRVIEMTAMHVLLESLRGADATIRTPQKTLLGMASIVALRTLSLDESRAG